MKEIFYKVTLLSDVVLNNNMATEGNMSTLDYIPGSNFLGIVANKLYKDTTDEMYYIFHSSKVRFGDATISENNLISYTLPAMYYTDKLKDNLESDPVYLDYLIDRKQPPVNEQCKLIQLKQVRGGYFLSDYTLLSKKIKKSFTIKSAIDRNTRSSSNGKMFGIESLNKGLEFIFSVQFDDDKLLKSVSDALIGNHRLGKSKNAEFGQINIERIDLAIQQTETFEMNNKVLVYAQSNLCFIDEFGMPTFRPTSEQLGIENGKVDYLRSQIRTHCYSTWNFKRNTTNTQRNCITKGSVFVIEGGKKSIDKAVVGIYQTEGLGRVIYNPLFLQGDDKAKINFNFKELKNNIEGNEVTPKTSTVLTSFLSSKLNEKKTEKEISEAIQNLVYSDSVEIKNLKKISSSQWGGIRAYATKIKDYETLEKQLFDEKIGYLTHGVADEKYWGKNRGRNFNAFYKIFKDNHKGTQFIAKFAAEMAKESRKSDSIKKQ